MFNFGGLACAFTLFAASLQNKRDSNLIRENTEGELKMIKAIVYHTRTGYTEKYARALSEKINLPCYKLDRALGELGKNDEVIYMGNISSGAVNGYGKARKNFNVVYVVGVGISYPTNEHKEDVRDKTEVFNVPFYLLRGGIDYSQIGHLKGFFFRKFAELCYACRERGEDTKHDNETIKVMMNGGDFFDPEYLQPIVDWYNEQKAKDEQQ